MKRGLITYLTTLASTPTQGPLSSNVGMDTYANYFAETIPAGTLQNLYLYWGYKNLLPKDIDIRNLSQSAAGVVEIRNFLSTLSFLFTISRINDDRTSGLVNEYALMQALNEELMNGVICTWYPDFDNYPAEYYSCVANKRLSPRRIGSRPLWEYDFDLMVLPTVQMPSTVPPFVMV